MIQINKVGAESVEPLKALLGGNTDRVCQSSLGVLILWNVRDAQRYAADNGVLYLFNDNGDNFDFLYPIGAADDGKALATVERIAEENGKAITFSYLTFEQAKAVKKYFNDRIILTDNRDEGDYIYNYADLLNLSGKKYHGQKNHVNRFRAEYPNYEYLAYSAELRPLADEFLKEYYATQQKTDPLFKDEKVAIKFLLDDFDRLPFFGGMIKVGEKVIALSFAERLGDTMYVHFEKALREYSGSYAIINQEFCAHNYDEKILYINREEDMGDDGIRQAKLSLHPICIQNSYFSENPIK